MYNHGDLSTCSLAEIAAHLEESTGGDLVRQAIELEALATEWLDPANLSPNHAKMLQHMTADRGITLESIAHDALRELQAARWGGKTDPLLDREFATSSETPPVAIEEAALRELQNLISRKAQAPSQRNTNFPA